MRRTPGVGSVPPGRPVGTPRARYPECSTAVEPESASTEKGARGRFRDRKISETFLSFAEPLLQDLPTEGLVPHVEEVLTVAYTAWKAVVIADVLGEDRYLADVRHRLGNDPVTTALVETLVSRKRTLFGDDAGIIGSYEVRKTADGFHVQADARDPYTIPVASGSDGVALRQSPALRRGDRAETEEDDTVAEIPSEYRGWWRITETSQWTDDGLDILGPALISLTGHADRLRMHCLLAYVSCKPTKKGVSFTWEGAWEYDQMSGSGHVTLRKDGRLHGFFRIKDGDSSTFVAERAEEPSDPIPSPPSYRDKWRRRW